MTQIMTVARFCPSCRDSLDHVATYEVRMGTTRLFPKLECVDCGDDLGDSDRRSIRQAMIDGVSLNFVTDEKKRRERP